MTMTTRGVKQAQPETPPAVLKLSTEKRQELYTLMAQWHRNSDMQYQKVVEWLEANVLGRVA